MHALYINLVWSRKESNRVYECINEELLLHRIEGIRILVSTQGCGSDSFDFDFPLRSRNNGRNK